MRSEGMTLAGIEPATFRFVAQHLNHCATAVPHSLQCEYFSEPSGEHLMKYKKRCSVCSMIGFAIIGLLSTNNERQGHCVLGSNKGWMWQMCVYSVGIYFHSF